MNIKKITIMVLDEHNKGHRAVFDGDGNHVSGPEDLAQLVADVVLDDAADDHDGPGSVDDKFDDSEQTPVEIPK